MWQSSTWWGLLAPDGLHFSDEAVDWVWLPKGDSGFFVPSSSPGGKNVVPPDSPIMAVRLDFSAGGDLRWTPSGTSVFAKVVLHVGASHVTDSGCGRGSRCARLDVNRDDPGEMAMVADL